MGQLHVGDALTPRQWDELERTVQSYDVEKRRHSSRRGGYSCNFIETGKPKPGFSAELLEQLLGRINDSEHLRWYGKHLDAASLQLYHASIAWMEEGSELDVHNHKDGGWQGPELAGTVVYQLNMGNRIEGGEFVALDNGKPILTVPAGSQQAVILPPAKDHRVNLIREIETFDSYRVSLVLHYL